MPFPLLSRDGLMPLHCDPVLGLGMQSPSFKGFSPSFLHEESEQLQSLSPLTAEPELFFSPPFLPSLLPPRLPSPELSLSAPPLSSSDPRPRTHWLQPESASTATLTVSLPTPNAALLPPTAQDAPFLPTAELLSTSSDSSPAAAQPLVTPTRRRRRRRLDALPLEERRSVLRASHREVDAARRAREAALLNALQRTAASRHGDAPQLRAGRRDKVAVLEYSLQEIERLRARTLRLEQREREKDARIAALRGEMERQRSMTHSLSAADPLYAAAFLQSNLCLCLIDVRTGTVLDVSRQYCALTGWSQRDVLHTSVSPVECGMPASRMSPHHMRPPTAEEELEVRSELWYRRRFIPQYPSARSSLVQLMAGQVGRVDGMGRLAKSNGSVYEITWTAWLGRVDSTDDGRGGVIRQPQHIVMAAAIEDALLASADLTLSSIDHAAQT